MVVPPINFVRQGPADVDPRALIEVINDCNVKSMFGSPVLLENMGRFALKNGIKTPSLKRIVGAGDIIKASVEKLLLEMMDADGEVYSNYGATEAMPSTEMDAVAVSYTHLGIKRKIIYPTKKKSREINCRK